MIEDVEPSGMNDQERYMAACHAMQSGVAMEMNYTGDAEPKHLRVGINSGMVSHGALVNLLVKKGVFSMDEYWKSLADSMEDEVKRYEARLSSRFSRPVSLG